MESSFNDEASRMESLLSSESDVLLEHAKEISDSGVLNKYIKDEDILELISILRSEKDDRGIGSMLVTDDNGMVLTRMSAIERRGDLVYQTSSWGRSLAKGMDVSSFENGVAWPLIIVGATPVYENEEPIGSIVAAEIVDEGFLERLKNDHLMDGGHIAAYSMEHGVLSTTVEDNEVDQVIRSYFTNASDVISKRHSGQVR